MIELFKILVCCASLVFVLYLISALCRARRLKKEQIEIARSDAWERKMQQRENDYDNV